MMCRFTAPLVLSISIPLVALSSPIPSPAKTFLLGISSSGKGTASVSRRNDVLLPIEPRSSKYHANITIGTPGQIIEFEVDTGSSDTWVTSGDGTDNTFNPDGSSTYSTYREGDFEIRYVSPNTYARGDWFQDSATLADNVTITDAMMGLATEETLPFPVLGLGFTLNEASTTRSSPAFTYDNFPVLLKKQGFIDTLSYSIYLSKDDGQWEVLFGGIDDSKYAGELVTIPISGYSKGQAATFRLMLNDVEGFEKESTYSYPAILDTGSAYIYVPQAVFYNWGSKFGTYSSTYGLYLVDCDSTGDDLVFKFDGKHITVPYRDMVVQSGSLCVFGVLPNPSTSATAYFILGDIFLRNAYTYFNLEDETIGLAQAV